ncbi:MAG TPA: hypothetical protein DCX82_06390 [Lachnospiraceae bacterium]|jgi:multiple sugar transport system substrate-binding protein|nr:hypothetical protein [Lachnospiraceae bacterium]
MLNLQTIWQDFYLFFCLPEFYNKGEASNILTGERNMKKFSQTFVVIICLVLSIALLGGCNGGQSTPKSGDDHSKNGEKDVSKKVAIEWSVWGNPGENKKFEEFTVDFNKKHANDIELKYTPIPNAGYSQKILSGLAAGTAPDVFYVGADISTFIKEDRLVDLAPGMKSSETIKPEAFALNIFGTAKDGDHIWGIVPDCNPMVIYYNTDMIHSLGEKTPQEYLDAGNWNWDAFENIAKQAAKKGKHGFVFDSSSWHNMSLFLNQAGDGLIFNPEGTKVDLDLPEKAEGIKFMEKLRQDKAITSTVQLPKGQDGVSLFVSQQTAMTIFGRWAVPVFKDIDNFEWDIVPFPKTASGKEVPSAVTIAYVCMNKDTKNPDEAFTFMEEFLNKEGQLYRLKDGGNALPSLVDPDLASIAEDGVVGHAKYFTELRDTGLGVPKGIQNSPEASQAVFDVIGQMCLGKINSDTCIKEAVEKGNKKLDGE